MRITPLTASIRARSRTHTSRRRSHFLATGTTITQRVIRTGCTSAIMVATDFGSVIFQTVDGTSMIEQPHVLSNQSVELTATRCSLTFPDD